MNRLSKDWILALFSIDYAGLSVFYHFYRTQKPPFWPRVSGGRPIVGQGWDSLIDWFAKCYLMLKLCRASAYVRWADHAERKLVTITRKIHPEPRSKILTYLISKACVEFFRLQQRLSLPRSLHLPIKNDLAFFRLEKMSTDEKPLSYSAREGQVAAALRSDTQI